MACANEDHDVDVVTVGRCRWCGLETVSWSFLDRMVANEIAWRAMDLSPR